VSSFNPKQGIGTLVTHLTEGEDPNHSHVTPIYQSATFEFEDVAQGAALFRHENTGYIYTRLNNPNQEQVIKKIAALEGLDLLRAHPDAPADEIVGGLLFASGMAAITATLTAIAKNGQTILAQESLYSGTYSFLTRFAPHYGLNVVWLENSTPEGWEAAFKTHPQAVLAYAETPANPTMAITDLKEVAEIAHRYHARLVVDNTFATPYCQRPLGLGADVVVLSTTKYLSGHGLVIGGAAVSRDVGFVSNELRSRLELLGGSASPFDAWLTNIGLKTFEVRMQRHCENALGVARFLQAHPAVTQVYYPGLESHPGHDVAQRQMSAFGGMMSFELKGGMEAGIRMMQKVKVCTLAVSLGNVDSLISHPASMSATNVPPETRRKMGITDGLVRFSVGIENIEDLIEDLDQAMQGFS
jgi:methionine-gamma-lyase